MSGSCPKITMQAGGYGFYLVPIDLPFPGSFSPEVSLLENGAREILEGKKVENRGRCQKLQTRPWSHTHLSPTTFSEFTPMTFTILICEMGLVGRLLLQRLP